MTRDEKLTYMRAWGKADPGQSRARKRSRVRNRAYVAAYLRGKACIDCGEADPVVLELDHVTGIKSADVSDLCREGVSQVRIDKELEQCVVRCANCRSPQDLSRARPKS